MASPTVLYAHKQFHRGAMRKQRVSEAEIISAIRESGSGSLEDIQVIVLESNAELSVVKKGPGGSLDTVASISGYD